MLAFSALTLLVAWQEGHPACKIKKMGVRGGGHWLVRMEWRPAGWSVCLPLFNLPLHHKVQKPSSGTGSPGWSWKKGCKTVVVVVCVRHSAVIWPHFMGVARISRRGSVQRTKSVELQQRTSHFTRVYYCQPSDGWYRKILPWLQLHFYIRVRYFFDNIHTVRVFYAKYEREQCNTHLLINGRRLSVTEVRALYGRLSCGWLGWVCAWRYTLRWDVGVAGWAWSLHSKQLGATGSAHRLGAF